MTTIHDMTDDELLRHYEHLKRRRASLHDEREDSVAHQGELDELLDIACAEIVHRGLLDIEGYGRRADRSCETDDLPF